MRASLTLLLVVLASAFLTAQTTSVDSSAVTSMERKLERIKSNGALPHLHSATIYPCIPDDCFYFFLV